MVAHVGNMRNHEGRYRGPCHSPQGGTADMPKIVAGGSLDGAARFCVYLRWVARRCGSYFGEGLKMSGTNRRIVQQRNDGDWEVIKPGASRASSVVPTQADGIDRGRAILRADGGGELQVRGVNGQIRAQDTIEPGNDPRSSRG